MKIRNFDDCMDRLTWLLATLDCEDPKTEVDVFLRIDREGNGSVGTGGGGQIVYRRPPILDESPGFADGLTLEERVSEVLLECRSWYELRAFDVLHRFLD